MEKVLVSIVVPVYNSQKYLERCLKSLINQTLKEIEVICVDDGSTDKSLEILKSLAGQDNRIKILNGGHFGVSAARNKGIDFASGEFIAFVDSDDWIDIDFYEKLYLSAKKYDADIAVAGVVRLNEWRQKYFLKFETEIVSCDEYEKFRICDIPDKNYIWNKIYKLSELRYNKLRFVEGMYYEDIIFTPQAVYCLEKLVSVPNVLYYYWRTKGSIVAHKGGVYERDYQNATRMATEFMSECGMDVDKLQTCVKRYRFFGLTLFKIIVKGLETRYYLFNILIKTVAKV